MYFCACFNCIQQRPSSQAVGVCASANTEDSSNRPRATSQRAAKATRTLLFSSYNRRRKQTNTMAQRHPTRRFVLLLWATWNSSMELWSRARVRLEDRNDFQILCYLRSQCFVFQQHLRHLNVSSATGAIFYAFAPRENKRQNVLSDLIFVKRNNID